MKTYAFRGLWAALILLAGCTNPPPEAVPVGSEVPRLIFQGLNGERFDSAQWSGRVVVLNLWATWCIPCRKEMPSLEQLNKTLDREHFLIIGLSLDTDRNLVREFAMHYGVSFPLAVDPDGKTLMPLLGVWALPDTLIIAPNGRLADRIRGGADWGSDTMRQRVLAAYRNWKPSGAWNRRGFGKSTMTGDEKIFRTISSKPGFAKRSIAGKD